MVGSRSSSILPDPSKANLPKRRFSEVLVFPLLNPPPVASGRLHLLRRFAALARLGGSWAEKIGFQEAFKNCSNFDTISTSIFERLGSVLGGQDGSQIDQKSIKIEFPSLSLSASILTSVFDRFLLPTSSPES